MDTTILTTLCLQRLDNLIGHIENKVQRKEMLPILEEAKIILHAIESDPTEFNNQESSLHYLNFLRERISLVFAREIVIANSFPWENAYTLASSCENSIRWGIRSGYSTKHLATSLEDMIAVTVHIEQVKYTLQTTLERQTLELLTTAIQSIQEYKNNFTNYSASWITNPENVQAVYHTNTHTSEFSLMKVQSIAFNTLLDSLPAPPRFSDYHSYINLFKAAHAIYTQSIVALSQENARHGITIYTEKLSLANPLSITTHIKITSISKAILIARFLDSTNYNSSPVQLKTEETLLKNIGNELQLNTRSDLKTAISLVKEKRASWGAERINHKACIGNIEIFFLAEENTVTFLIEEKILIDFDTFIKTRIIKSNIENKHFLNIHHYIVRKRNHFTGNIYIRPVESGQVRALFFTNEKVYLCFNRKKLKDSLLGQGSLKTVTFAVDLASGAFFASASIKLSNNSETTANELFYLRHFTNKRGFVQLVDQVRYQSKTRLILELQSKGNLNRVIKNNPSLQNKKNIFENLVIALLSMHQEDLLHRDLKPGNILCRKNRENILEAVIADFDTVCPQNDITQLDEHCTTSWWASPEYARAMIEKSSLVPVTTKAHDIWALGIILHQLLGGTWNTDSSEAFAFQSIADIKQGPAPTEIFFPSHLIWEMTQIDPKKRISIETAAKRLPLLIWE